MDSTSRPPFWLGPRNCVQYCALGAAAQAPGNLSVTRHNQSTQLDAWMHFLITNLFSAASWKLPVDPSSPQVRFLGPHGIMQEPHHFAELLAQPELGVWDEQFGRPASRFPCGIRFLLS